jgi:hypothetical protein
MTFTITEEHKRWARNRRKQYGHPVQYYLELIQEQEGKCAFSKVSLLFDSSYGTSIKGGKGCHPLYAALDHTSPGSDKYGHKIVCYALNDLKGHLPQRCFAALEATEAWIELMKKWKETAEGHKDDREAFKKLLNS